MARHRRGRARRGGRQGNPSVDQARNSGGKGRDSSGAEAGNRDADPSRADQSLPAGIRHAGPALWKEAVAPLWKEFEALAIHVRGSTPLHYAAKREMLDRMAEDPDEEEHLGPLHDAAKEGKMDACKHLVENLGFDVDVCANDGSGKTPLTCAVSCDKVIAVRYLIAKGADLNKQDAMGFTPLHYAAKGGHNGIARLLLTRGANVDVESSEGTPLHVAAARGRFGVMEILLEHHADPDRLSPDLCTPLATILIAAYEKASPSACLKCIKLLVKAGADLNSTNPDTPLVIATSRGLNEIVDYLLEVGADANIPIKHGHKTPIEIAAKSGRRTLVESLFPFTSPIQTISDWSVEGILAYARSRQPKHKDTKNQMNSNSERSVKEDASAPTGCTEDKLSDEDMKAQLKLQAVKGNDFAGASKFYTKGVLKCIVMLVCCMMVVGTVSAKEHCDSAQLKDQMGFCNAEDPNTLCCSTVYSIVGRSSLDTNSSCVCDVIQAGVSADKLKKYYYRCHGKNQGVDLLISQCKGTAPPPPPPSDTSPPPPAESTAPPAAVKQSWSKTTKIAFVILASIVITLSVWLTYLLIKKYKGQDITVNPSTEMSSIPRDTRLDIAPPMDQPEPGVVQDTQVENDASPEYYYDAPETEPIVERPPERKGWMVDMIFVPLWGGLRMLSHSVF